MKYTLMLLAVQLLSASAYTAEIAGGSKVTPLAWLQQQTPPRFKPGHTLPRLGQMHCVNPPADVRAELARSWGFAVRLDRPKGEPELLQLCAGNPTLYQPATMIGNLANMETDPSRKWPEGTFLCKYCWKLIATEGLRAEFITQVGQNVNPAWERATGNHQPPNSSAVDATGLYRQGSVNEGAHWASTFSIWLCAIHTIQTRTSSAS